MTTYELSAQERLNIFLYNEPDGERRNMSVDRAGIGPIKSIGMPLASPSPVHYDNDWMIWIMRRADEADLRIDYLAFHWYGGTDPRFLDLLIESGGINWWITDLLLQAGIQIREK